MLSFIRILFDRKIVFIIMGFHAFTHVREFNPARKRKKAALQEEGKTCPCSLKSMKRKAELDPLHSLEEQVGQFQKLGGL